MTECCLLPCCRPSTSSRLLNSIYPPASSASRIKALVEYSVMYPRKLHLTCRKLEARIKKDYGKSKLDNVRVGIDAFRALCRAAMYTDLSEVIEVYISRTILLLMHSDELAYLSIAYDAFLDYTDCCDACDIGQFVNPIENLCNRAKFLSQSADLATIGLRFMSSLIGVLSPRTGELEKCLHSIVAVVFDHYKSETGHSTEELFIDDDGTLTPYSAARSCLLALSMNPSPTTVVHIVAALISVFDINAWEPLEPIQSILEIFTLSSAKLGWHQAPISHVLVSHARNMTILALPEANSSPSPSTVRPCSFTPRIDEVQLRSERGSEAVQRTLVKRCEILTKITSCAAAVLRIQSSLSGDFYPLLAFLESDWGNLIIVLNFCARHLRDVSVIWPKMIEICNSKTMKFPWAEAVSYSSANEEDSRARERDNALLDLIQSTALCMRQIALAGPTVRFTASLLQKLCRALSVVEGRRQSDPTALLGVSRILLLYSACLVMERLCDTLCTGQGSSELGREQEEVSQYLSQSFFTVNSVQLFLSLQDTCQLCVYIQSMDGRYNAISHSLSIVFCTLIARAESALISLTRVRNSEVHAALRTSIVEQQRRNDIANSVLQQRNVILHDAIFSVLCSHAGEIGGQCHAASVAAVWSLQETLLSSFGAREAVLSLPMVLAMEDFWLAFPLETMSTPEAVSRSLQLISGLVMFVCSYLRSLHKLYGCEVRRIYDRLLGDVDKYRLRDDSAPYLSLSEEGLAVSTPADSSSGVLSSGVEAKRPGSIDRHQLMEIMLDCPAFELEFESIQKAFTEQFIPIEDPFERLYNMNASEQLDEESGTLSPSSASRPQLPSGTAGSISRHTAGPALPSSQWRGTGEKNSGIISSIATAKVLRSSLFLDRDTTLHPTQKWTEKCNILSKSTQGISDFSEHRQGHEERKSESKCVENESLTHCLKEINNLNVFDICKPQREY